MSLQAVTLNVAGKIKADVGTALTNIGTILTRLSAARAAKLDTMLSTAQWSNGRAAKLDNLDAPISGIGGGGIKSVQRGISSIAAWVAYVNVPISAVNMSKSFVVISSEGQYTSNSSAVRGRLSSGANLALERTATAAAQNISWEVVEFN